jgi:glycosyltransferase involved in cell wall biosynthesis
MHMRIGLFHGYELTGSGSNEYTRYLARALADQGHEVHVICREPHPQAAGVDAAIAWDADGNPTALFGEPGGDGSVTLHRLPHAAVRPVYVTDKQREGNVKAFTDLTDEELGQVREVAGRALAGVLTQFPVDVLHANHMVLQPTIAADVCPALGIPYVIYPHGSDIEYTIRNDDRYLTLAGEALAQSSGLITGSHEMVERVTKLYPDQRARISAEHEVVGVGVDVDLFSRVPKDGRAASIAALAATDPGGGKTAAQAAEFRRRLDSGDLTTIRTTAGSYAREQPDDGVAQALTRIPWQDGKVLLFVGALTGGKGLQSVIVALPEVLRSVPSAHLVIVGSGAFREVLEALVHAIASGNEELLDAVVSRGNDFEDTPTSGPWPDVADYLADPGNRQVVLASGPEFADHVHFVGRMGHDRLQYLFPCADLAVFPSIVPEAYPLVLMESLASGVLPCASDTTGLGEGLTLLEPDLGVGLVERLRLPMDDHVRVGMIAQRLTSLLTDPALDDLGGRLREIAVTEYDWPVRATEMTAAYQRFVTTDDGAAAQK